MIFLYQVLETVEKLNNDPSVHGIIVQVSYMCIPFLFLQSACKLKMPFWRNLKIDSYFWKSVNEDSFSLMNAVKIYRLYLIKCL